MRRIFYLSTCSTCQRILKEIRPGSNVTLQDIKTEAIRPDQIDRMAELAGSCEALFSRRAMKYRSLGLADRNLTESDYRALILDEYTFLKRPVAVLGNRIFIGSSKKTVDALKRALSK